jgi:tyrosyl-tRNA synthetase
MEKNSIECRVHQTVLQYLQSLQPALPFSVEQKCKPMLSSELRRHIEQGGVLINTERVTAKEMESAELLSFNPRVVIFLFAKVVKYTNEAIDVSCLVDGESE